MCPALCQVLGTHRCPDLTPVLKVLQPVGATDSDSTGYDGAGGSRVAMRRHHPGLGAQEEAAIIEIRRI